MTASCMGGFQCPKRGHCRWHQSEDRSDPHESLCEPGQYGAYLAINLHETQTTASQEISMTQKHIPLPERLASILAMLTPAGVSTNEITEAMGFKTRSRTSVLLRKLTADGKVFHAGAGNTAQRWFLNTEDRDAYLIQYRAEMAERRIANCRAASRRYRGTVELPTMRVRVEDAKEAKQQRDKAEKRKTQTRLKKETKAAGSLVFKTGTDIARPKKTPWADMPVIIPEGVKLVKLESKLRDRFAVDAAPSVVSSQECRKWAEAVAA